MHPLTVVSVRGRSEMPVRSWVFSLCAAGLVFACGGDDDSGDSSTGGTGGGGTGGSSTGGASGGGGASGASGGSDGGLLGGSGGGDATSCGDFGQTADCKTCLAGKCCSQAGACAGNADCAAFVTCARACPAPTDTSSACVKTCITDHNAGGGVYNPILICMQTDCGTQCPYL